MTDLLQLQSDVARAIAEEISATITPVEYRRLGTRQSQNAAAQEAYLRGLYLRAHLNPNDLSLAVANFEQAVQLDPGFAVAWAGLAFAWRERGVWGGFTMRDVEPKARDAVHRALGIDPQLPDAIAESGQLKFLYDWDWAGSESDLRRALRIEPSNATANQAMAMLMMALGRFPESLAHAQRVAEADPLASQAHSSWGRILYRARRYPEAKARLERAIELNPNDLSAWGRLADVLIELGEFQRGLECLERASTLAGRPLRYTAQQVYALARMGRRELARKRLDEILGGTAGTQIGSDATPVAQALFALGDLDRGCDWLEKAFARRDLVVFVKFEPKHDAAKGFPRYEKIIARLKIPDPPR